MKKLTLLLFFAFFTSCSNNETAPTNTTYQSLKYYTINDGIREDYTLTNPITINITGKDIIIMTDGKANQYVVSKIVNDIYYISIQALIDNDNGTPTYYVTNSFTFQVFSNEIVMKDADHPQTHPSYFEVHFII
ncbi:hypothetical protein CXF59_01135 [Flavobacterium sp. ALD4]|uniref:hypothetical protein n=1 Tax=Flavobacterium sp. ALD4 TaxID=2058314 RepID=UPI000C343B14|nr:hypothetical protein [Flavobacterium sp. ALD4]PKH68910.1 hypothetical protein CXF59_01135 [Flavobacterium sp. ALD4]